MRFTGRGTDLAPPNRFETLRQVPDWEQLTADDELLSDERRLPTAFLPDKAQTLIRENELLIVDGTHHVVIVNPDKSVLAEYRRLGGRWTTARVVALASIGHAYHVVKIAVERPDRCAVLQLFGGRRTN